MCRVGGRRTRGGEWVNTVFLHEIHKSHNNFKNHPYDRGYECWRQAVAPCPLFLASQGGKAWMLTSLEGWSWIWNGWGLQDPTVAGSEYYLEKVFSEDFNEIDLLDDLSLYAYIYSWWVTHIHFIWDESGYRILGKGFFLKFHCLKFKVLWMHSL